MSTSTNLLLPAVLLLCQAVAMTTAAAHCDHFFHGNPWPEPTTSGRRVRLCQTQAVGTKETGPYFATLYDVSRKIPVYSASAHVLTQLKSDKRPGAYLWDRKAKALCTLHKLTPCPVYSYVGGPLTAQLRAQCRFQQALASDYFKSGFHRGHLEPSHINRRTLPMSATFTLTNAAPQRAAFNVNPWRRLEQGVERIVLEAGNGAKGERVYVITGVGGNDGKINNRVVIPEVFWKAVCFPASATGGVGAWSFGYWMWNDNDDELPTEMYALRDFAASFPPATFPFLTDDLFADPCTNADPPVYFDSKLFK